jgi:DNA-binding NtrC family response regulator
VVLMTAYADLETAIDALRAGAADFLLKPFSVAQMLNAVKRCFERSSLRRENFVLRRELDRRDDSVEGMVGKSAVIREVCARIKRIAPMPSTVLIHGESGTGKELAARALHRMSPRGSGKNPGPFVPINCAAIAEELIESELFGHVKGAFTGAAAGREGLFYYARGGTLFLDEVSELPLPLQAKLLRVLEEHKVRPVGSEQEVPVDVRVVAATNRNLKEAISHGRFREDLFYRLNVFPIHIPPLRDRPEDIPALATYYLDVYSRKFSRGFREIDQAALRLLAAYRWPGNIRELKNTMERICIMQSGPILLPAHLPADISPPVAAAPAAPSPPLLPDEGLEEAVARFERSLIVAALEECRGNVLQASQLLRIPRGTLRYRMDRLNIPSSRTDG